MECADIAALTFATNKILVVIICKLVNLFWILQVCAVDLSNWSEFFGCFIEASSDI